MNDHALETAGFDVGDLAGDFGDDRLSLGLSGLEQLDDPQQTSHLVFKHLQNSLDRPNALALHALDAVFNGDQTAADVFVKVAQGFLLLLLDFRDSGQILARDASGVECSHRKLGSRLTDRLRRDDADGSPGFDRPPERHVAAVALAQIPCRSSQVSGERMPTLVMPGCVDLLRGLLGDHLAGRDNRLVLARQE